MAAGERLSRRDFLKFTGLNLAALTIPAPSLDLLSFIPNWPSLPFELLPDKIQAILHLVPEIEIGPDGYLLIRDRNGRYSGRGPQAVTQWNQENSSHADRLYNNHPWGIVLHWYGDRENFDRSVKGYLRGFDSLREVDGEILRTSAHFLVGDAKTSPGDLERKSKIGILQTQAPARDGIPFVASHLRPINYQAHQDRKQYFVRALYQLGSQDPRVHSLLQDLYDGPKLDPNMRTIAVEITGYNFDKPDSYPSKQKIANVISLVWALMKRYQIPAENLLGHHEIQLSKADPGKKFMTTIRYLIGIKALVEHDNQMKKLVFGQLIPQSIDIKSVALEYFKLVRDYLVMVSTPRTCYEWEAESKFWLFHDNLQTSTKSIKIAHEFNPPFPWETIILGGDFLQPENHEGVDLHYQAGDWNAPVFQPNVVHLIADGVCEFIGMSQRCRTGQAAIFRHRQPDGAEILSIYSHLIEPGSIQIGKSYPVGYRIGSLDHHAKNNASFLHFSIAYGASWELGLHRGPDIPLNAGTNWIKQRYLEPLDYLSKRVYHSPEILSPNI